MSAQKVLLVDDSVASLDSMAIFFEIEGYEVRTARDGLEGVAAASDFKPSVVFLDIQMPGLDGYQAAEMIRDSPGGDVPKLVAITGWSRDEDRERAEEAGFDRILCKPVCPESLRETLAELLPANGATPLSGGGSRGA